MKDAVKSRYRLEKVTKADSRHDQLTSMLAFLLTTFFLELSEIPPEISLPAGRPECSIIHKLQ